MKIAYFDLNYPDHSEDYSVFPKRYGGGRVFAANAKEAFNNDENEFWLFSDAKSFDNVTTQEKWLQCIRISPEIKQKLRDGEVLDEVMKGVFPERPFFDILVHHHTNIRINSPLPQVTWSLGIQEHVNPGHKHVILYNDYQNPILFNPGTQILKARIGKDIPPFQERTKEDFVFQCTRHTPNFGSIEVADWCLRHGVKGIFAGPIDNGYPLMSYIDGKTTQYLGVIDEATKLDYTARARLYTFLHSWPTPFNLSAVEALSLGTPIVSTSAGFWPSLVEEGVNGFMISRTENLIEAWNNAPKISQYKCYQSVKQFSTENMLSDFYKAFETVIKG